MRRQTGLFGAAGVAASLGIVMLNVSAFLALAEVVSTPLAALIVAVANLIIAGVLASVAGNQSAEAETAPVTEVRDMALEDIDAELQVFVAEAKTTADNVKRMARDPVGMVAPGIASAVAKAVVSSLSK
ncbi:phage holin family protein [Tropicimonas sp. TH_r6]|uniref:phage holin family protein n=1 Tax=Tropicimonas sp. TH_r6 TaxID=3082085 RepID=UPI00295473F5|nr:phage holin family protein [Tropicimonas sp. TH_r6]MDV7143856.1 phage holin family protein [Tropicimonas sp. TH_r6]